MLSNEEIITVVGLVSIQIKPITAMHFVSSRSSRATGLSHTVMVTQLSSPESYDEILNSIDTWLFDCDGVLWHGDRPIEGVVEVIARLRKMPGP